MSFFDPFTYTKKEIQSQNSKNKVKGCKNYSTIITAKLITSKVRQPPSHILRTYTLMA